jgi:hypothetical protein
VIYVSIDFETPVHRFVSVVQAELDRLRADYDIRLMHGRAVAAQEQRCNRCGFYIQHGQDIILVERADRSRKDWIHDFGTCPEPATA